MARPSLWCSASFWRNQCYDHETWRTIYEVRQWPAGVFPICHNVDDSYSEMLRLRLTCAGFTLFGQVKSFSFDLIIILVVFKLYRWNCAVPLRCEKYFLILKTCICQVLWFYRQNKSGQLFILFVNLVLRWCTIMCTDFADPFYKIEIIFVYIYKKQNLILLIIHKYINDII